MFRIVAAGYAPLALCTATVGPAMIYHFRTWAEAKSKMRRYYDAVNIDVDEGDDGRFLALTITDNPNSAAKHISAGSFSQDNIIPEVEYPREALLAIMPTVTRDVDMFAEVHGDFLMFSHPK